MRKLKGGRFSLNFRSIGSVVSGFANLVSHFICNESNNCPICSYIGGLLINWRSLNIQ